jgi:hypothetical protein
MQSINFPASMNAPEYLQMHRRALRSTPYGIGNVIKADIKDGRVVFIHNVTGTVYSNYRDAFNAADVMGMTSFTQLTGTMSEATGKVRGMAGFNERISSMKQMLRDDAALLDKFNQGLENKKLSRAEDLYFTIEEGRIPAGQSSLAKNILRNISEGRGFMFKTKDSGTFIRAFVKDGNENLELTSAELNRLFYLTSDGAGGIFSNNAVLKAMSKGDLGPLFSKASKRGKGIFSLDGVSLAGNDLASIIKSSVGQEKTFGEAIKVFDTAEDLSKISISYLDNYVHGISDESIVSKAMMGATRKQIDEAVGFYGGSGAVQTAIDVMEELSIISTNDAGFASVVAENSDIVEVLRGNLTVDQLSDNHQQLYKELMTSFERPYDGTSLISDKFVRSFRSNMQKEINALEKNKSTRDLTTKEYDRLQELKSYERLSREGFDAETIRFYFKDADGNVQLIKGVGSSAEFTKSLRGYAVLTTKVNLKNELAVTGGTDVANLVFQGNAKDMVTLDPLAPAFHGEIFSSEEALEATRIRNARILNSYEKALEDGIFDPSLKKEIYKTADEILEGLPQEVMAVKERSKMFAQSLKQAIESGTDINSTPQLANYLQNFVHSLMIREKNGMLLPVMEDTFRLSIDTELGYYSGRRKVVGDSASLKAVTNLRLSAEADAGKIGLMNFKVRGHKMLMAGHASNIFHHSLGTFDLDDKGVPIMRTMKIFGDDGVEIGERIGFFTFRQPTGPGEYVLSMAEFDTETIRGTFGKNEGLVSHLNDIVNQGTDNELFKTLQKIVSPENMSNDEIRQMDKLLGSTLDASMGRRAIKLGQGKIHSAMLDIMQSAEDAGVYKKVALSSDIIEDLSGGRYGSTLALDKNIIDKLIKSGTKAENLTTAYNQGNIYKVFAETGVFNLEKETVDTLRSTNLVSSSEKSAIFSAAEAAERAKKGTGDAEILKGFAELANRKRSDDLFEFLNTTVSSEYSAKQLIAEQMQESLGNYINRLTLVSAPTRQAEDILSKLDPTTAKRLREMHKVGLIDPSAAVDFVSTMTSGNSINDKTTLSHYTTSLSETLRGSISEAIAGGGDAEGVARSLVKLMGRQEELLSNNKPVKILDTVGALAVEEQGRFMGAIRAAAYKQGLTSAEDMLGIDELILKNRAKGGDIRTLVEGMISGFESEFGDELAEANELATSFLKSLYEAKNARTNEDVNAALVRTMGLTTGKYAGASATSRLAHETYLAERKIALSARGSRLQPFMSEAVISKEGGEAADAIMQMHELLRSQFAQVLSDTDELSNLMSYESRVASQYIGDQLHKGILAAAQEKGTTIQEVIDNLDFLSSTQRGPSIDRYLTAGDDPNELTKLFRNARDARAMSYYKKQEDLMGLVDQYDQYKNMRSGPRSSMKKSLIDDYQNFKTNPTFMDSDYARVAEAVMLGEEGFDKNTLGLTEEQNRVASQIRQASDTRSRLTPEVEDMLSRRGDAIGFAPSEISDDLRSVLDGGADASVGGSGPPRNGAYKRISDSFGEGGAMRQAFENPTIRKAGYAGLAVIAASFLYRHNKDRTQEDISGPPLLPGGSAYEAMPSRDPQVPQASMFSGYNQGTSYSINLEGSADQINNFRSAAGSVAGGAINSTMYKGLPRLGSNPYSEVASSY